jgi:hypothetical protein
VFSFLLFSLHLLLLFRQRLCQPFRKDPHYLHSVLLPLRSGRSPWIFVAGHQLRQCSAASATSACCYHCCCGDARDHFSSDSFCSAASVRVSTSSSFSSWRLPFCYDRDRMRPHLLLPLLVCRFGLPFWCLTPKGDRYESCESKGELGS